MSINHVVISGNLTRDPELRQTAGGMAVLDMSMAVNDRRKNSQTGEWEDCPNYVDVTVFGTRGESLSRMLSKGSKVTIDGKLRWSQWNDKNSGEKRSRITVIADDVDLPPRSDSHRESYAAPAPSSAPVFDDDIPF